MPTILIADDTPQITEVLSQYAKRDGFTPIVATTGKDALKAFREHSPDIILLDVMMPEMNGYDVCRAIRKESDVPIIMITARGEDFDQIMGLDLGADDYIVKPFSPVLVMANVRAVLRRLNIGEVKSKQIFTYDDLTINMIEYSVKIGNEYIHLTKKEIELLWTMATNANRVFSREVLLDLLWGDEYYGDTRAVDSHMKRLRTKIDSVPHPSWSISTIWGVGYKFKTGKE